MIIMEYKKEGNFREYLQQQKNDELSFKNKLFRLKDITIGLKNIHNQNLVHRDFNSGTILNSRFSSFIADFGLSLPVNYTKEEGIIFGVLPYVAPEVLQGQLYTQKADIYSHGIIM